MRHEEREIERHCVQLARRRGWDCWKNENNGNKGIPDYSLLSPDGRFLMVEFKRSATAHVRPEQLTWQRKHPDIVFFCHDLETFKKILEPRRIVCGDCFRILDECAGFHETTDDPCVRFKLNIER